MSESEENGRDLASLVVARTGGLVATGDRFRDLSVRLRYAGVDHRTEPDPRRAVLVASEDGDTVDVIGNYTAFHDLLAAPP